MGQVLFYMVNVIFIGKYNQLIDNFDYEFSDLEESKKLFMLGQVILNYDGKDYTHIIATEIKSSINFKEFAKDLYQNINFKEFDKVNEFDKYAMLYDAILIALDNYSENYIVLDDN